MSNYPAKARDDRETNSQADHRDKGTQNGQRIGALEFPDATHAGREGAQGT